MEDSVDAIKAGSDDTAGTADDFTNLIAKYQGPFAHSYVFDGAVRLPRSRARQRDADGQVTGAADWHINSDEPDSSTTTRPSSRRRRRRCTSRTSTGPRTTTPSWLA